MCVAVDEVWTIHNDQFQFSKLERMKAGGFQKRNQLLVATTANIDFGLLIALSTLRNTQLYSTVLPYNEGGLVTPSTLCCPNMSL